MPLTVSRLTFLSTGASSILPVIVGNSCSGNVAFQSRGITVQVEVLTGSPSGDRHTLAHRHTGDVDADRSHILSTQAREPLARAAHQRLRAGGDRVVDVDGVPDEHVRQVRPDWRFLARS